MTCTIRSISTNFDTATDQVFDAILVQFRKNLSFFEWNQIFDIPNRGVAVYQTVQNLWHSLVGPYTCHNINMEANEAIIAVWRAILEGFDQNFNFGLVYATYIYFCNISLHHNILKCPFYMYNETKTKKKLIKLPLEGSKNGNFIKTQNLWFCKKNQIFDIQCWFSSTWWHNVY